MRTPPVVLWLALWSCAGATIDVECRVPRLMSVTRLEARVVEPRQSWGCDDVALGLVSDDAVNAATTRSFTARPPAALELGELSLVQRQLIVVAGAVDDGGIVGMGCSELRDHRAVITLEPVTTASLKVSGDQPLEFELQVTDLGGRPARGKGLLQVQYPSSPKLVSAVVDVDGGSRITAPTAGADWWGPIRAQLNLRWSSPVAVEAMSLPLFSMKAPTPQRLGVVKLPNGGFTVLKSDSCAGPMCQAALTRADGSAVASGVLEWAVAPKEGGDQVVAMVRKPPMPGMPAVTTLTLLDPNSGATVRQLNLAQQEQDLVVTASSDQCGELAVMTRASTGRDAGVDLTLRALSDFTPVATHPVVTAAAEGWALVAGGCVRVGTGWRWASWQSASQALFGQRLQLGPTVYPLVAMGTGIYFDRKEGAVVAVMPDLLQGRVSLVSFDGEQQLVEERLAPSGLMIPVVSTRGDFNGDGVRDTAILMQVVRAPSASRLLMQLGAPDGGFSASHTTLTGPWCAPQLVAADLNGNGRDELMLSSTTVGDPACRGGVYALELGPRP